MKHGVIVIGQRGGRPQGAVEEDNGLGGSVERVPRKRGSLGRGEKE